MARRRSRLLSGAFFSVLLLVGAARAAAQEPTVPQRDTLRRATPADSLRPPADTTAQDTTAADTLKPPPPLVAMPRDTLAGWSRGAWEWNREALLASGAFSLADLLERIPSVLTIRSGVYAQPEVVLPPGGGFGRVEITLDGFPLQTLDGPTYDLSGIELNQLQRVRVERWPDRLRIQLWTFSPETPRSETQIEAGTGDQNTNLFRGSVRFPSLLGTPVAVAFERLGTDGVAPDGAGNRMSIWGKWSLISGGTGLQLELRRRTISRDAGPGAGSLARSDWVGRLRRELAPGLVAEAFVGASSVQDTVGAELVRRSTLEAGARAGYRAGPLEADGAVDHRTQDELPATTARASLALGSVVGISGGGFLEWQDWGAAGSAFSYGAQAELGPFLGVQPFVQVSGGRSGVPFAGQSGPVFQDGRSLRAGVHIGWGGFQLGAAGIRLDNDSTRSLGLPFDNNTQSYPGANQDLLEVTARVPTGLAPIWLEGSLTRSTKPPETIYLPNQSWRVALVLHYLPLASGHLEFYSRLERQSRGAFLEPTTDGSLVTIPPLNPWDFYLQIRVLTVRAFVRWHFLGYRVLQYDIPDHIFPIQRTDYGVKWTFHN
ncbi:MAG: Plug domain-containing protein [Gemmatimonadota bacterium]